MRARQLLGCLLSGLLVSLVLSAAQPAAAEPTGAAPPVSPLSAKPTTMWQTDQTVWALAYSQNVLYVGGSFTTVRPPGAPLGSSQQSQARLAAFNATTGEFIDTWRPVIGGGDVYSLEVSPDNSRLYVGGGFTAVNSTTHQRLAAFNIADPTSPVLLNSSQFGARTNRRVTDIDATNDTVWAGGNFTTAGATPRTYVAAFAANGGGVLPFNVNLSGVSAPSYTSPFVTAVQLDGQGNLAVGGLFDRVNDVTQHGFAMVNAATGERLAGFTSPPLINTSYVTAAVFQDGRLFIAGRDDKSGSTDRLEGVMAMDARNGQILWGSNQHRCLGDSFSLQVISGSVWVGTHAHDCKKVGTFPETNPRFYAAVLGQDVATGEQDHFYPDTSGKSTVPGSLNNVRAFATDGQRLFVGGGFAAVNGIQQQNLTVFEPKTGGGTAPVKVAKPTATANLTGGATVSWIASSDRDNRTLTYDVFRRNSSTPFATIQAQSAFWYKPGLSVVDSSVQSGESVYYKVRVSDESNKVMSVASTTITIP